MSLENYSSEKRAKMSLVELTKKMMLEEKKEMKFKEAFTRASDLKGLSESARSGKISQYYTDLNIDGAFVTSGSNMWGLKSWYRDEKKEDEEEEKIVIPRVKRRKKKRKLDDDDLASEFAMIDSHIDEVSDREFNEEDDLEIELDDGFDDEFEEEEDE